MSICSAVCHIMGRTSTEGVDRTSAHRRAEQDVTVSRNSNIDDQDS